MPSAAMKRVYVWELPVRIFHWINALCIVVLIVTGYIIGNPPALQSASEASFGYWFGIVRFIHFVTAFVLVFNFIVRIYWAIVGNRYAKWRNFILFRGKDWKEVGQVLKVDILQARAQPLDTIGHNRLAALTYFLSFLVFLFQVATGFGMYSAMSDATLPNLFAWVVPLMGGDFAVRQWHHMMMWFFVIFTMVHIYLVFYHDYVEGRGGTSSMVGGWKFIEGEKKLPENATDQPPESQDTATDKGSQA